MHKARPDVTVEKEGPRPAKTRRILQAGPADGSLQKVSIKGNPAAPALRLANQGVAVTANSTGKSRAPFREQATTLQTGAGKNPVKGSTASAIEIHKADPVN
jgi:hypothetical protein